MSEWFSGPPVSASHVWNDGAALDAPDRDTVLSWTVGTTDLVVLGPRTRAHYYRDPRTDAPRVLLRFRPGRARLFLGRPVRDLADACVPLRNLDVDLPDDLRRAMATQARIVDEAARLFDGPRPEPVHLAARRLHVSERHLRDLFTAATGLPPRSYAQIERVRTVLSAPDTPLPELALRAGYYDQSHMTAEFRRLMGSPPAAFRAGRWPEPQRCGGSPRWGG